MNGPPRFVAADAALLRMPVLPVAAGDGTRADLAPDCDGYPQRLREFVQQLLTDLLLREAVEVSSDALAGALRRIDAGVPVELAKLRRAAHAAARYRLRMSGRPTPFGLLAGVAVAGFETGAAKVRIGPHHRKGVRPDAGWLAGMVARWERDPAVRRRLRVTANDLCLERGERLVLPYLPVDSHHHRAQPVREVSVRLTPPVRLAIELAAAPVTCLDLTSRLGSAYPRASAAAVEAMVGQLIEREFLLTDLRPPLADPDPLGYLIERLAGSGQPELAALQEIAAGLARYAAQPLGAGRPAWRAAVTAMRALHPTEQLPIQVDLRMDADVTLPQAVAEEVARAAGVLWRLAVPHPTPPHLRQYHQAFLERYGVDRLVRLAEVIDADRGLGAPSGYRQPPSDRRLEPDREPEHQSRDGALAALAEQALLAGTGEVVLDDDLVAKLAIDEPAAPPPPDTVELVVQVLAESAISLAAGDFQLWVPPGISSSTAGAMFGRFAYLFEAGAYPTASSVADDPEPAVRDPAPLAAQMVFRPVDPRAANVLQVPRSCEHQVAVGTFAERADPQVLGLADLAVGADHHRLYLVSLRDGREVLARSPHMLNVEFSTANPVRLIREIVAARHRPLSGWTWGAVSILPRLPQVRYGRTVLSPAMWRAGAALRDRNRTWRRWGAELAAWRDRWQVPDRVQVAILDHRLELDLTVPIHQQLLRDELSRRPDTVLLAAVGTGSWTGWLDGHTNEVVVPLTVTGPARATPARIRVPERPPAGPGRRAHLPGGEWLYAKLYCSPTGHDELLAEHLTPLVEDLPAVVDRWFFLRYADPDPHLRLRFHGPPAELHAQLFPRLHDWATGLCDAGLAGRMTIDTYDPELERYGGPAVIEAAERAFAADSYAALALIQLRRQGLALPADLLTAASYVDLLRAFGDPDWREWLLDENPRGQHHRAFQAVRQEAIRLIDPAGAWSRLSGMDGGAGVLKAWRHREAAVAAYGAAVRRQAAGNRLTGPRRAILAALLHLHHNRHMGVDPVAEARSLAIASGTVRAHLDRARSGS